MRDDSLQIKGYVLYDRLTMVSKEYRVLRTVNDNQTKVVYKGTLDMCEKFLRVRRRMERSRKWKQLKKYAKIRFKRFWDEWGFTKQEMLDLLGAVSLWIILAMVIIVAAILRG